MKEEAPMQSFSYKAKAELCRTAVQRLCCARAECYGVLLYCNTFTMQEVRIITENPEFAARLPRLFHRAFNVKFDRLPAEETPGSKLIFQITDPDKLRRIVDTLGYDPRQALAPPLDPPPPVGGLANAPAALRSTYFSDAHVIRKMI